MGTKQRTNRRKHLRTNYRFDMRAKRVDANQKQIVAALRKIPGVTVHLTHMVADGFPDIVVGYKGRNYLFEIKDGSKPPSAQKLTPDEQVFHDTWKGQVNIATCFDDIYFSIIKPKQ